MAFFGGGVVTFLMQSVMLTDAETKALPTTPVTIVPAEIGILLYPLFAHARMQWVADYTNIDASALFQVRLGASSETLIPLSNAVGSSVSALLAGGGPDGTHAFFSPRFSTAGGAFSSLANFYDSDVVNQPIMAIIDNGLSGNLTGGNAGNSLSIEAYYVRIPVA